MTKYYKPVSVILLIVLLVLGEGRSYAGKYSPEISGNFEIGDREYIDVYEAAVGGDTELIEEVVDVFNYRKMWLRYKQQLSSKEYYYIKGEYTDEVYEEKDKSNNKTYEIWTNYTFCLSDVVRNRVMLDLRKKDYYNNPRNSYKQARLTYELMFDLNEKNDLTITISRQWQNYQEAETKDNIYDRIALNWEHRLYENLTLNSELQYDWTAFKPASSSTDKNNRKFNLGFEWKM